MKKQKGFTLIELIIVAAIVGIVGVLAFSMVGSCAGNKTEAKAAAKQWAIDMGLDPKGVTCVNRDTNGDGYVSCNVSYSDSRGDLQVRAVECAAGWASFNNDGCRTPAVKVNQQ